MFRVDDGSMVVSVSKRVGTRSSVTMCHARGHKNAVEIVRIAHHACDLPIVVEAVLWRDGGVRQPAYWISFPPWSLNRLKSGLVEFAIEAMDRAAVSSSSLRSRNGHVGFPSTALHQNAAVIAYWLPGAVDDVPTSHLGQSIAFDPVPGS